LKEVEVEMGGLMYRVIFTTAEDRFKTQHLAASSAYS